MTMLIRFSRSADRPFCSGAAVGKLPAKTNEKVSTNASGVRMTENFITMLRPTDRQAPSSWMVNLAKTEVPRYQGVNKTMRPIYYEYNNRHVTRLPLASR